jgi:hypothetical protein
MLNHVQFEVVRMFAALVVSPSPPLFLSPLKKKNNLYIHTPGEGPKRKH